MYLVYCDGELLYDPTVEELEIFEKKISLEVNKTGGFDFKIYPSHPMYSRINRLKSAIEVYQDKFLLFRGRVLNDEHDFFNAKNIICEGDLAFLNDGVIRPYSYEGTVRGFLQYVLDEYNKQVEPEKRFVLGTVGELDANDYITRSSINADTAWEVINNALIDLLGGYIVLRREDDTNYIDYLADSESQSLQEIELGQNLLDLNKSLKGENIITALIPYGAKLKNDEGSDTDERLTITDVNDGKDYVFNQEAVDKYGWIFGTKTWDDVTISSNLLTKARADLDSQINIDVSIELTAIDLSMTDEQIGQFRIFEYVKANSPEHLLNDYMLITKMVIDMDNPQNNKITLGLNYSTFTDKQVQTEKAVKKVNTDIKGAVSEVKIYTDSGLIKQETELNSNIEKTAESIRSEVASYYTSESALESLRQSVSTQFEQTNESFNYTFNDLTQQISLMDGETKAQFEEIVKYIRFVNGNIILGEVGNEITLQIEHDRISFLQNGSEVAYFSNNQLYITDAHVLNSIQIGNFAFIPRVNGSLDFKKVVN